MCRRKSIRKLIETVLILLFGYIFCATLRCDRNAPSIPGHRAAVDIQLKKKDWHDYAAMKADFKRKGPGEHGSAIQWDQYQKELYNEYGFNAVLSDQISVNRSVPDTRPEECKSLIHSARLPKAAIIIIFFNERLSVLLRTVYSIINRSPDELVHEILLVDDCSTYSELHDTLENYLDINLPTERSKVRLIRLPERSGLMRARMIGARAAAKESEVLIFLDSHFEMNYNWLPPLLEPMALNSKICTCPAFDHIAFSNFAYTKRDSSRGYFDWNFAFTFFPVEYETNKPKMPAENYQEYILAGGAIAIGTEFFWNLGGFDEGMTFWGGEQYELSFKIWMCGGEILHIPCSRMGHLFRDPKTKGNTNLYGNYSFYDTNLRRLVDVWVDEEYRQYFFNRRPALKAANPGDLSSRRAIRDRLKCKSFSWMMENILTGINQIYPPVIPVDLANGRLTSENDPKLCLALKNNTEPILETCPVDGNKNWIYNWRGQIRMGSKCLEPRLWSNVSSWDCHIFGGIQKWYYDRENRWLAHVRSNVCMVANTEDRILNLANCDPKRLDMKWTFSFINQTQIDAYENALGWNSTKKEEKKL